MSKLRPYEFVPTVALLILVREYEKLVNNGDFKKQRDLDLMIQELNERLDVKTKTRR